MSLISLFQIISTTPSSSDSATYLLQKSNTVNSYSNQKQQHRARLSNPTTSAAADGAVATTMVNGNADTTKPVVKAGSAAASAAKLELDALSKVLEFQVNYKTFPTKGPSSDVVTLVTLKTNPPKVSVDFFC